VNVKIYMSNKHFHFQRGKTLHQLVLYLDIIHKKSAVNTSVSVIVRQYINVSSEYKNGKVTSVLLFFNWTPCHGVLWEWRYSSTHSLTSALDGGERSASRPGCFTPWERAPDTHWIGGWVGPRAVLDMVVKRKIPSPCWELNPRTPIVQPVA
jgi:hypothetical protein